MAAEHTVGNIVCIYKDNKKIFEYCSGYNGYENKTPLFMVTDTKVAEQVL